MRTSNLLPFLMSLTVPPTVNADPCPAEASLKAKVTLCSGLKWASNSVAMLTCGGHPVAFCTTRKSLVTISMMWPVCRMKSPFPPESPLPPPPPVPEDRHPGMLLWWWCEEAALEESLVLLACARN